MMASIQSDIANSIHITKSCRQPYAVSKKAGYQTSAESWGTGRAGLDMVTKHYAEATGSNIVLFLPEREGDFASYTEFLQYLSVKNKAGVASTSMQPLSQLQSQSLLLHSHSIDKQQIAPPRMEYSGVPLKEEKALQWDYNRAVTSPKQLILPTSDFLPVQLVRSTNTGAVSQAGVNLTPELIATLASEAPAKEKPSGLKSVQLHLKSSSLRPSLPMSATLDNIILPQGYRHQAPKQTGHSS
ncbi:hypothetical protein F0562_003432 [Nyssa sinensis]|uniref:Spen paralogue and orthologue SPOC C-terminal domain-containing protein n=1 Tax=Nyssa sinensis TaxID=561372 RepID=A0A5J5BV51_9ASTE|nr:hypothetical protein F0562_003432 [Nyssa sinensis]